MLDIKKGIYVKIIKKSMLLLIVISTIMLSFSGCFPFDIKDRFKKEEKEGTPDEVKQQELMDYWNRKYPDEEIKEKWFEQESKGLLRLVDDKYKMNFSKMIDGEYVRITVERCEDHNDGKVLYIVDNYYGYKYGKQYEEYFKEMISDILPDNKCYADYKDKYFDEEYVTFDDMFKEGRQGFFLDIYVKNSDIKTKEELEKKKDEIVDCMKKESKVSWFSIYVLKDEIYKDFTCDSSKRDGVVFSINYLENINVHK